MIETRHFMQDQYWDCSSVNIRMANLEKENADLKSSLDHCEEALRSFQVANGELKAHVKAMQETTSAELEALKAVAKAAEELKLSKTSEHDWKGDPQKAVYQVERQTLVKLFAALAALKGTL